MEGAPPTSVLPVLVFLQRQNHNGIYQVGSKQHYGVGCVLCLTSSLSHRQTNALPVTHPQQGEDGTLSQASASSFRRWIGSVGNHEYGRKTGFFDP